MFLMLKLPVSVFNVCIRTHSFNELACTRPEVTQTECNHNYANGKCTDTCIALFYFIGVPKVLSY